MEAFVKKLLSRLDSEISRVNFECNAVKGYDLCVQIAKRCFYELKEYLAQNPITDESSEIYYLKHAVPSVYSWHIYFIKLYNMELGRITVPPENFICYLSKELKEVSGIFETHAELHRYYYSQHEDMDPLFFTKKYNQQSSDETAIIIDSSLCPNSVHLARILAYEKYRIILRKELDQPNTSPNLSIKKAAWKGSKSDLVELIVAYHASNLIFIDNQPATLTQIKEMQESIYNIDLKDFDVIDNKNRSRKKSDAPLLSKMIAGYISRKDRLT
jgi:hypothetical protein